MIKVTLKRSILNYSMLLSFVLISLIFLKAMLSYKVFTSNTDVLYMITIPMGMSGFTPFACLFPLLPYAFSFAEEFNSGYIKNILPRSGYNKYILSKIMFTGLSGGIVMVLGFGSLFLLVSIIGKPTTSENISQFYQFTIWTKYAFILGGRLVLLFKLFLSFLFGIVWAEVGLLISSIYPNRYVAFILPFVLYQVLWNLLSNSIFNPLYLLRGDYGGYSSLAVPVFIQLVVISLLTLVIAVLLKRKIKNV